MIRRIYKKRFGGIVVRSGYVYTFKYQAWENDPKPTVVMLYALDGIHPNTGHQWRFFQGINMTYVPRTIRRRFIEDWIKHLEKTKDVKLTWGMIQEEYPQLKYAVRRYFFRPSYYITNIKEVPIADMEKVVISTWSKDFSRKIKTTLLSKFRRIMKNRSKKKKRKL